MYHKLAHYKCAGKLLQEAKEHGKNAKTTLYNDKKYKFMNIKSLYALVNEALKHWDVLQALIKESNILIAESGLNIWHVRILITELLFGKKVIDGENKIGEIILRYETKFKEILSTRSIRKLLKDEPGKIVKVRYIKVNPIIESVDSVIDCFVREGWTCLETSDTYSGYLDQLRELEPGSHHFLQDFHIPEVFAFPAGTELHFHELNKNGAFTLMDKSSCLAPYLLRPHPGSKVLDMCAAPGLKSVHLAGIVDTGKVYAVERDGERFTSLQKMVTQCRAHNVQPIHQDVTKLNYKEFADVEYILLDPSCSGSGIRDRQPNIELEAHSNDQNRLYRLAGFQLTLLRFALTRFPAAKRVVYSTCSLNVEENEEVVQSALNSKYHDFEIVSIKKKVPQWINFGSSDFEFGSKCIYSLPETDLTNGFFVAVFERKRHYSKDEAKDLVVKSQEGKNDIKVKEKTLPGEKPFKKELNQNDENLPTNICKNLAIKNCNTEPYDNNAVLSKKLKYDHYNNNYDSVNEKSTSRHITFEEYNSESFEDNKNNLKDSMHLHREKVDDKNQNRLKNKKLSASAKKHIRQRKNKLTIQNTATKPKKEATKKNIDNNKRVFSKKESATCENICNNSQEYKKPISKAKLRYKRLKALKLALRSGKLDELSNNSNGVQKKKSKSKKRKTILAEYERDEIPSGEISEPCNRKHKKKHTKDEHDEMPFSEISEPCNKKHKKKHTKDKHDEIQSSEISEPCNKKHKKKHTKDKHGEIPSSEISDPCKNKNKYTNDEHDEIPSSEISEPCTKKHKKKHTTDEHDEIPSCKISEPCKSKNKHTKDTLIQNESVLINGTKATEHEKMETNELLLSIIKKKKNKSLDNSLDENLTLADENVESGYLEINIDLQHGEFMKKQKKKSKNKHKADISLDEDSSTRCNGDVNNLVNGMGIEYVKKKGEKSQEANYEALLPACKIEKRKSSSKHKKEKHDKDENCNSIKHNDLSDSESMPYPKKKCKNG